MRPTAYYGRCQIILGWIVAMALSVEGEMTFRKRTPGGKPFGKIPRFAGLDPFSENA